MSKTIDYFYEISKIPRESGNEAGMAEYLCNFAKERNLFYVKDQYNNVIIKKKNENKPAIILQAHTDMVCEKELNKEFNFETDSIEVYEEEGYLKAKGTTLGADNGIGVAQILNVLDSDINCNVEAIFTATEETTMVGAENINIDSLEATQMINLDGFEENTIIIASAGFFDIILEPKVDFVSKKVNEIYKVSLIGMEGGHSGFDINKNRGNASIELANLLGKIEDIELINFVGGTKFNVIPSSAEAYFYSNITAENLEEILQAFVEEKRGLHKNLSVSFEKLNTYEFNKKELLKSEEKADEDSKIDILENKESKAFLKAVYEFKHGVFCKNSKEEITTSINLGVVDLRNKVFKIGMRSSSKEEETKCLECIEKYSKENNMKFIILGSQPGFETSENSAFVQKIKGAFEKTNPNEKLKINSVHITVEAGFFKEKKQNLEVAIISPKILGAHTVKECVSIESIKKCDMWLKEVLENI